MAFIDYYLFNIIQKLFSTIYLINNFINIVYKRPEKQFSSAAAKCKTGSRNLFCYIVDVIYESIKLSNITQTINSHHFRSLLRRTADISGRKGLRRGTDFNKFVNTRNFITRLVQ